MRSEASIQPEGVQKSRTMTPLVSYRMWTPLIALAMISRWISEVPSKIA